MVYYDSIDRLRRFSKLIVRLVAGNDFCRRDSAYNAETVDHLTEYRACPVKLVTAANSFVLFLYFLGYSFQIGQIVLILLLILVEQSRSKRFVAKLLGELLNDRVNILRLIVIDDVELRVAALL